MTDGGGSIVIISSTASVKGAEGMILYGGAKAALRSMVRSWILDLRGTGIRVNVLTSGAVNTPSLRTALAYAVGDDQVDAAVARSEEHTSELLSLLRITYAVLCLKKKTTYTATLITIT